MFNPPIYSIVISVLTDHCYFYMFLFRGFLKGVTVTGVSQGFVGTCDD